MKEVNRDNLVDFLLKQTRINRIETDRLKKKAKENKGNVNQEDRDVAWMIAGQSALTEILIEEFGLE